MTLVLTRIDIGRLARTGDKAFPLQQTGRIQFNRLDGMQSVQTHTVMFGPECQKHPPDAARRCAAIHILKEAMRIVAEKSPPPSPGAYSTTELHDIMGMRV